MLLDFSTLYNKYNLKISGIIHIGAHTGEEHFTYIQYGIPAVIYFEPVPWCYSILHNNVHQLNNQYKSNIETYIERYALGNSNQSIDMYISKHKTCIEAFAASSSILAPQKHLELHPDVEFNNTIEVEMKKLDDYNGKLTNYNFINIDVQGYELEVFKGAEKTLHNIDYIMSEVNIDDVYENCAKIEDLDKYLEQYKFRRVETCMGGGLWGDAFYIKDKQ